MLSRRELLAALAAPARPKPNLILILADDMGWGDLACYGQTPIQTPHLDALAASGIRYENFHAASAVCTPSRAAVLTGRYPLRFDIRKAFNDDESHLPLVPTLPKLLRAAGYATAHVGKWHLGGLHLKHGRDRAHSIPGPHQHGFDHYLCQNEEQPLRGEMGKARTLFRKGGTCLIRNDQPVPESDPYYHRHFTDINGDEAVRLVREYHAAKKPFFLNLWFLDPHQPYEPAPEPFWSKAAAPGLSHDQQCDRSMIMHLDHKVGQLVKTLEELGLRENTLILFSSDNGGAYEANIGPYKGGKTDLHEGGLRVPGIVSWPARLPKGVVSRTLVHHCDILPAFCAAAGVTAPAERDGVDLLSPAIERPRTLHWQIDHYRLQRHYAKPLPHATEAVRQGRWKLLARDGVPMALYDLESDPLESMNRLEDSSAPAAALVAELRRFLSAPRDRSGF